MEFENPDCLIICKYDYRNGFKNDLSVYNGKSFAYKYEKF